MIIKTQLSRKTERAPAGIKRMRRALDAANEQAFEHERETLARLGYAIKETSLRHYEIFDGDRATGVSLRILGGEPRVSRDLPDKLLATGEALGRFSEYLAARFLGAKEPSAGARAVAQTRRLFHAPERAERYDKRTYDLYSSDPEKRAAARAKLEAGGATFSPNPTETRSQVGDDFTREFGAVGAALASNDRGGVGPSESAGKNAGSDRDSGPEMDMG